jgi:phosphoribosylformimino-5-aminoimidazole carboxamide ribotide isomerase
MIVLPAIDLRAGACVQVGEAYDPQHIDIPDPLAVARQWARLGFRLLHVVDLDAATGRGSNEALLRGMLGDREAPMQVGGGVCSSEMIEQLFGDGAVRVVLGIRALEDPDWLVEMSSMYPGELVVAADVRDRRAVSRGWARSPVRSMLDIVEELNELPLAAVLVTAVHRQGQLAGTDLSLMEDVAELSEHPVLASGGITTMHELRSLADRGVGGTVIGMALYTGALDARMVAEEFSE